MAQVLPCGGLAVAVLESSSCPGDAKAVEDLNKARVTGSGENLARDAMHAIFLGIARRSGENAPFKNGTQANKVHHFMGQNINQEGIKARLNILPVRCPENALVIQLNAVQLAAFPGARHGRRPLHVQDFCQRRVGQRAPVAVPTRQEIVWQVLPMVGRNAIVARGALLGFP